jgi:prophage antirepressor-like protein
MNIIQKDFNGFNVRILLNSEKEYFIAKDIAELLKYERPAKAVSDHCKRVVKLSSILKSPVSGDLEKEVDHFRNLLGTKWSSTQLIPESDVWRLIIKSRLPEAEKIEEWIMEEVLPSIRKTGSYSLQKEEKVEFDFEEIQKVVKIGIGFLSDLKNLNPVEKIELDTFVKQKTGESLLEDFGISFENHYFLPTEIGNMIGMSGAEINLILEKKGLQKRDENGVWKPTEKGSDFCLEIGNKFNQLKWRISTIL